MFIAPSFFFLPERDVWPPKCRKALPIVAPFPPSQNESTRCRSWRAAGVDTVANARWYKSLLMPTSWPYLPQHLKKNHMQNGKRMMKYGQLFFTFKRKFVHPRERWGAGNGFLPGLKCSAIVVLEDTWNYWWISTVESKWKKKKKRGCCRHKNIRLLYSTTWKMTVGEAIGGETRSVLVNPLIYQPVTRARHRRRAETFEMWWMVTPCWTPSRFKL